jgi:hypothetical protein
MAEACAFVGNCPMGDDIIELVGGCTKNRGENCGKVAAFGMLKWQFDELAELDDEEPIEGTFTVTTTPAGFPPEHIRQEWVGVELPVRSMERINDDFEVEINPVDAILSLLNNGKLDGADWFMKAGIAFSAFGPSWVFRSNEGEAKLTEAVSSMDFYGAKLTPEIREALES